MFLVNSVAFSRTSSMRSPLSFCRFVLSAPMKTKVCSPCANDSFGMLERRIAPDGTLTQPPASGTR